MKLFKKIKRKFWSIISKGGRVSYSQCGEDMMLDAIFYNVYNGIYVDVGANNPFIQSNTQYFYNKGWHGINIDALPGSMKRFNKIRVRDINIEAAISNDHSELTYYMFKSSFYNTFDREEIERLKTISELTGKLKIKTIKLSEIFESQNIEIIDFMSVDVEGLDLEVLKSNNWQKYRPKIIVIEAITYSLLEIDHISKIKYFLESVGYKLFCNSPTNFFYIEIEFYKVRFEGLNS